MASKTWKQLKAAGVKRCCATFVGGKQCRRRADKDGSWCVKHRPFFDRVDREISKGETT